MHLTRLRPCRLAARVPFLFRCLKNRGVVEQVLDNQAAGALIDCALNNPIAGALIGCVLNSPAASRLVDCVLHDQPFFAECARQRDELKLYFSSGLQLRSLPLDLGTMLYNDEIDLLKALVERANSLPGPIIEIGTLFGYTTSRIALWRSPEKKIITVDNYCYNPWNLMPDMHHALTRRFLHYLEASGQVTIERMDKNEFFSSYCGPAPALVFLDADHSYEATKADIAWARTVGAGIISGHDYSEHCPGVVRAVEEAGGAARRAGGVWSLHDAHWQSSAEAA